MPFVSLSLSITIKDTTLTDLIQMISAQGAKIGHIGPPPPFICDLPPTQPDLTVGLQY